MTYNCENFYGHYDNRKNINVVEPKKSQRNQEDEYPLTGHRLLLGFKIHSELTVLSPTTAYRVLTIF